ncbi:AEC family transporter [Virgibacillus sp. MSP4-1]|uniref:AEC family transporter n=1 Tax=Virgibacillus sp. MSP4-1 TaxID=2700081 RepID=UPI0003AA8226|nr:AEC family transporter [Virgibacillus sp. MSP4-1]QHS21791.1 AEC family transporter [Virgibacillus sp. MSP4-1]
MASFNQQFLYSIIIISLGYLLKRTNFIKERDGEGLSRIIFNLTLPALIIVSFHDVTLDASLILLVVIGLVYGLIMGAVGIFIFRKQEQKTKGMLTMMVPGFNIGLFAYPLVEGIWGSKGIQYFGMFDMGNAFIVFGLIYVIGAYYSDSSTPLNIRTITRQMTQSLPFMTFIVTIFISLASIPLPKALVETANIISVANMPLSLLLLGIYLNFTFERGYLKLIMQYMAVRYLTGIVVGLALFILLPFNNMFKYTVLIGLILPSSMSALPYAVEFNYDRRFVGTVTNMTIIISFLLMWLIANFVI